MKFVKAVLVLCFASAVFSLACNRKQEEGGEAASPELASILPCWEQSWDCGDWLPLTYTLNEANVLQGYTPEGKLLFLSTCELCDSLRLVDPEKTTQRIVLSYSARVKACKHRWASAAHTWSLEPIEPGDGILIIYQGRLFALDVREIRGGNFGRQEVSYGIAHIRKALNASTKVNWKQLNWELGNAVQEIPFADRKVAFVVLDLPAARTSLEKKFLNLAYDNYYACLGDSHIRPDGSTARIAIVHSPRLQNEGVVDLTQFRFKSWEDGLGNHCDVNEVN